MHINELKTGDLILFSGSESILSKIVQYFTNSSYSHIGMIVKDPCFTSPPLKGIYLWESGFEDFEDSEDGELKLGVQISDFNKVVKEANSNSTKLYVRKLNHNIIIVSNKLDNIHNVVHNKPYDIVPRDWIEALKRKDDDPQKTDRFWCSALVGYIYTKLGFLPKDTDWSILRPSDFSYTYNLSNINNSLSKEFKFN